MLLNDTQPTSLVTTRRTVDETPCLRQQSYWFYAVEQPTLRFPASCESYKCPRCGIVKARQIAAAMAWAINEADRGRFITLTLAPEGKTQRLQKMKDLTRWAKAQGYSYQQAWTTEAGSQNGMVHVHALQWGDFVPQAALQQRWGARVDIRAVRDTPGAVSSYMTKGAGAVGSYMTKGAAEDYGKWRDLNFGRPVRWSRGFFHGLPIKDAIAAGRGQQRTVSGLTWVRCHEKGLPALSE
uniref:Replication-associated protein ORF2/G2P domain-containing protein n=1 Tax=uncultured prokaryote TaxID=198431 RepID=A0A0H5PZW3_9ZZZZ|nr:hypothetical protein [uncultured prokaryote]